MICASRPLPKRRLSRVTNRRCAGMAIMPMLRKKCVSDLAAGIFREGNDRAQSRAGGYPAGILKVGSKTRKTSQASAHHRHRASPVAKKAGMDRKFNVGKLSARRATSSMARALGTKHKLKSTGSAQSTEPILISIYSIGPHLGYPISTFLAFTAI